jgi:hypothetical protein
VKACRLERQRADAGWAPFWRYLDLGRYGEQLQRLYLRFPRDRVLVLRYPQLRDAPAETLDTICGFLGVETGRIADVPAENVTAHASDSWPTRLWSSLLRAGAAIEPYVPPVLWQRAERLLSAQIQREQRPRQPLTPEQRAALIPHFTDDIRLLEELTGGSFADWLRPGQTPHVELRPAGPIGTAHNSIDRPLGDATP